MSGSSPAQDATVGQQELRQRIAQDPSVPHRAEDEDSAKQAVIKLNEAENDKDKPEGQKKTFGRTPSGTGKWTLARFTETLLSFVRTQWTNWQHEQSSPFRPRTTWSHSCSAHRNQRMLLICS